MPNIGVSDYIKQMSIALKEEIGNHSVIVGNLHTALSTVSRSFRQKNQ